MSLFKRICPKIQTIPSFKKIIFQLCYGSPHNGSTLLDFFFGSQMAFASPKFNCHWRVGSCLPRRNVSISASPSAGLLRGTKWPAPLIVAMVMPWYSTNLPATYIASIPHISATEI